MKYYAAYSLYDTAIIISEKTYKSLSESMKREHNYAVFDTFGAAKKWIYEGIQCDKRLANDRLHDLKSIIKELL